MTGVVNLTQSHEAANKLYINNQTTLVESFVDEKHRRAIIFYSASSIKL